MEEYMKKEQKRRKRIYCRNIILAILIVTLIALLYVAYTEIEVDSKPKIGMQSVEITKLSQTIEEVKQELINRINEYFSEISS